LARGGDASAAISGGWALMVQLELDLANRL
jgi:hypothetical protein